MKRWSVCTLLVLALVSALALAEDTCVIDVTQGEAEVVTECGYIRVTAPLEGDAVLTVRAPDGSVCYQRAYSGCDGAFSSEEIYLRQSSVQSRYEVSLACGDAAYSFAVTRRLPRMTRIAACSGGYPLSSITGSDAWQTVTLVDVAALEGGSMTVPLQACGQYGLGEVRLRVKDGGLTVTVHAMDGVSVNDASVLVAASSIAVMELRRSGYGVKRVNAPGCFSGALDTPIDLMGVAYVAVYTQLDVDFDPTLVEYAPTLTLPGQYECWLRLLEQTDSEAVG
ncbi:MAG: hypothetical protein Q4E72_03665 [bacterium]|nr:hypothetical protein [bacterium]